MHLACTQQPTKLHKSSFCKLCGDNKYHILVDLKAISDLYAEITALDGLGEINMHDTYTEFFVSLTQRTNQDCCFVIHFRHFGTSERSKSIINIIILLIYNPEPFQDFHKGVVRNLTIREHK